MVGDSRKKSVLRLFVSFKFQLSAQLDIPIAPFTFLSPVAWMMDSPERHAAGTCDEVLKADFDICGSDPQWETQAFTVALVVVTRITVSGWIRGPSYLS
jgi:hypothetical protein